MLSILSLSSLAAAVVEMDFSIRNSHVLHERSTAHNAVLQRRDAVSAAASNDTVEPVINASLTTSYNFYYGKLLMGTPQQELDVLLDTGSPITWVYGPEGSYNNATMFFPNRSATFTDRNYSLSAAYGSGEYLGSWGRDLVAAPQFVSRNVTYNATNCTSNGTRHSTKGKHHHSNSSSNYSVPFDFGVVTSFATSAGAPGLLGLGPHIANAGPSGYLSLPEAYAKHNVTSSSAFSVFLEGDSGRFLFGGVDLKYAQLPLFRYPARSPLYGSPSAPPSSGSWQLSLDSVSLNESSPYTVSGSVVLDTGSPVSLLPPGFVDAVGRAYNLKKYGRYETWYINGSTEHIQGNFTFTFKGVPFTADVRNFLVPGEYIWLEDGPQNVTALALMGSQNYLLGDAFFKSVYTVLNPATGDVLLAKRTQSLLNASNSTNATTVVPFSSLSKNISAIVNASDASVGGGSSDSTSTLTTSTAFVTVSTRKVVTASTPVVVAANQYLGTVPAEKAASMTGNSTSTAQSLSSATASSSTAAESTAAGSSESSSKSKNSAPTTNIPAVGCVLAAAALLI